MNQSEEMSTADWVKVGEAFGKLARAITVARTKPRNACPSCNGSKLAIDDLCIPCWCAKYTPTTVRSTNIG